MEVAELLGQATCAVLAASDGDRGASVGTAWLATDDGHLLTAGHVVTPLQDRGEVWVRFPDSDEDERATFAVPPVHDKRAALDFAVLRLDRPNGRAPLPFALISRVEGPVRVRGYGSNLPRSQSGGEGVLALAGNYLRESRSWAYYFQYSTGNLAEPGFSGGAVYSDVARAVIGLQVEAEGGRQAFAMPLARIAEYWADMLQAAVQPTRGVCVLIQPETSSEQERDIVRERIVRPVLEQMNLALYVSEAGGMRGEDLKQLELADVVIADITHADPTVIYELTVAQGMGTPDLVVSDRAVTDRRNRLFEVTELDLQDPEASRRLVEQRLLSVRSIFDALGEVASSNPVTAYFKAPLTEISAANSLALGYSTNFVLPVALALLDVSADRGPGGVSVDGTELSRAELADVTLTVVLPRSLSWANDDFIDVHLAQPGLVIPATVTHPDWSRPRALTCLPRGPDEPVRLLDVFPTTLSSMAESVDQRFGLDPGKRTLDYWIALERKEIDRFQSKLVKRLREQDRRVGKRRLGEVVRVVAWGSVFPGLEGA